MIGLRKLLTAAIACGLMSGAVAQVPTRGVGANRPAATRPQAMPPATANTSGSSTDAAASAVPSTGSAPVSYRIGPDDVIEVSVLGQADFKTRARVRSDGVIALPFLGNVKAEGETVVTFADKVAAQLRAGGYYAKPIVSVEIASFASNYVTVLGAVAQPGLQPVDRAYRLSEIIARVGGIRGDGADYVVVTNVGGQERRLPFERIARSSGGQEDPLVNPGDKIFVPQAEMFYIYGQVNAPGVYPVADAMTLRMALARGGGLTPSGSAKRLKVYHEGKEQRVGLDGTVHAGDVIVVGERIF